MDIVLSVVWSNQRRSESFVASEHENYETFLEKEKRWNKSFYLQYFTAKLQTGLFLILVMTLLPLGLPPSCSCFLLFNPVIAIMSLCHGSYRMTMCTHLNNGMVSFQWFVAMSTQPGKQRAVWDLNCCAFRLLGYFWQLNGLFLAEVERYSCIQRVNAFI